MDKVPNLRLHWKCKHRHCSWCCLKMLLWLQRWVINAIWWSIPGQWRQHLVTLLKIAKRCCCCSQLSVFLVKIIQPPESLIPKLGSRNNNAATCSTVKKESSGVASPNRFIEHYIHDMIIGWSAKFSGVCVIGFPVQDTLVVKVIERGNQG